MSKTPPPSVSHQVISQRIKSRPASEDHDLVYNNIQISYTSKSLLHAYHVAMRNGALR